MYVTEQRPKVSVIVPVYNTAPYLTKCLESLVQQTLQEIEIIVVNDGSTDASQAIIDDFAARYPEKFKVYFQENQGQAVARNFALTKAKGEYIGFLDSDDFAKLTMFETMYRTACEQEADFVCCGYRDITYRNGQEIVLQEYVGQSPCSTAKELYFGAIVSPFMHLYHRDVLKNSGAIFTAGYLYEDTAFYLNLLPFVKKPVFIKEALPTRVRRENSSTRLTSAKKVSDIFPVLQSSIAYYAEKELLATYQKELEYFCVRIALCSSLQRVSRVKNAAERSALVTQTFSFLHANFPQYKRNLYLQKPSAQNLYMRYLNPSLARVCLVGFGLFEKRKKYQ